MVALGYQPDKTNPSLIRYNCGGTLISVRHVLTAAHCVNNINNFVPVEVRLGAVDLNDNSAYVQRIQVGEIISHPRYKRSLNYYDIAIIKLRRAINVSNNVMPICLQTKPIPNLQQLVNMSLVVTGWGATSFENEGSADLQKTPSLQMIDKIECSVAYRGFSKLPNGLDGSMICVLDKNVTRRADACQGDSGGPLLLLSMVSSTVLGVTSFGQSCGSSIPAIYTSVIFYLDWIEDMVWPDKKRP
ncbi:serine protease persephone isoform X3 [Nasonia vitripennis]|nr:serine protease persephone isoform X3 [Nasonia vitripennis]